MLTCIDTHTGGEPTRTVIGGLPRIKGKTVSEKMLYMRDHMDWLRTFLMYEPRGHSVMSGALLVEPSDPRADVGVIYIETGGYLPMCGHDTIGCCTAMVEAGIVPAVEPETVIRLDTPAGLVTARVAVKEGAAESVTFKNVPCFLYLRDAEVQVPGYGRVTLDIAYGGNFYGILEARKLGLELKPEFAGGIIAAGNALRRAVNSQIRVQHPEKPFISGMTHVEFFGPPTQPEVDVRNTVVFPPGEIDRSPCGTGTSAKVATLWARGEMNMGRELVQESIIGTIFRARVAEEVEIAGYRGIIPEVTGSAYVTGIHQFVIDPRDPLKDGFLLGV
jgi:proline racemase